MVKVIVAAVAASVSLGVSAEAYSGKTECASVGKVSVDCKERGAWRFAERVAKDAAGVETLTVTLEADVDGWGTWVKAGAYALKAGVERTVELPAAFASYWARVRADRACTATAQFSYR